jgi:chromosome segregation ATPase
MNLVTDFERLDEQENLQAQISSLEDQFSSLEDQFSSRWDALDNRCSRLEQELEKERNQGQRYLTVMEGQTREIDKLTVALRTVNDESSQEQARQHVVIARLRASVRLNRIFVFFHVMLIVLTNLFLGHCWPQFRKSNDVPRSSNSKWS